MQSPGANFHAAAAPAMPAVRLCMSCRVSVRVTPLLRRTDLTAVTSNASKSPDADAADDDVFGNRCMTDVVAPDSGDIDTRCDLR